MKRLAVLTISLLAALCAFGGTAAFAAAEGGATVYPADEDFVKTLTFSNLLDYEIDGEIYYFVDGTTNYRYENGEITNVQPEEFTPAQTEIVTEKYYYYYDENGAFTAYEKINQHATVTFEGEYKNLKQFGDKIYAVKDNQLYSFEGTRDPEKINLEYADYTVARNIAVGQAASELKNYTLEFVTVAAGSYMTKVDLTKLDDEHFASGETITASEETVALLLCRTGNAEIIAIGDESYIVLDSKTKDKTDVSCYEEKEFENATIVGNRIYASPYVIIGTSSVDNAAGTIVKINNKLKLDGVLGSVYYEVSYTTADGKLKTGYVADGFLTKYIIEDNKEPTVIPDPSHSEKNNTTSIILVLLVVVLVLIAIGYLTYVSTKGKNKKGSAEEPKDKKDKKKAKKTK